MEFTNTNNTSNLCIFCYKVIPPEYYNDYNNTAKLNHFCATLSRLQDCQSGNKRKPVSSVSASSFGSCRDCEIITAHFTDLHHQLKCLELQLLWKLETLGKVMNSADKVDPLAVLKKQCVKIEDDNNICSDGNVQFDLQSFQTLRSEIKKKCKIILKLMELISLIYIFNNFNFLSLFNNSLIFIR